jgi:hypothetical protein
MKNVLIASFAAFASLSGPVAAMTFDLEGSNCSQSTLACFNSLPNSFTPAAVGGLTATFSAKAFTALDLVASDAGNVIVGATVIDGKLGRYSGGAGVFNSASDGHTVDSFDRMSSLNNFDFIEISFDSAVSLTNAKFGFFNRSAEAPDDFRWFWDSNNSGKIDSGDFFSSMSRIPSNGVFSGFGPIISRVFGIGAVDEELIRVCTRRNAQGECTRSRTSVDADDWKLKSISATVVPVPGAALLLMSAIAGLALVRRSQA